MSRYEQVQAFVSEPFWYIFLALTNPPVEGSPESQTVFNWKRGHLFDFEISIMIYEMVLESPMANVTKVIKKNTKKWLGIIILFLYFH